MIPDWPLGNPSSNLSGESVGQGQRTTMESGRVRQRDRFGTRTEVYSVSWLLTVAEYEAFLAFVATIDNGFSWFMLPLPESELLTPVQVRFINGTWSKSYVDFMHWRISAQVEAIVSQGPTTQEIDIMPLLLQEVIEQTESFTLSMTHQNKFLRCNPGEGETITVTLPANANFTDAFSCGLSNIGLGQVVFAGAGGVVLDSVDSATRIFRRFTPVTVTYVGANRFQAMGSLY